MTTQPSFESLHLVVADVEASMAFYRRLGLPVPEKRTGGGPLAVELRGGVQLVFESVELCRYYDPNWRGAESGATNSLQFALPTRQAVDDAYADLVAAGHNGHLAPFDAFWGARYAIVDDPDGNVVGLQSPVDPDKRSPYTGPR